jgi:hypothetical protein
MATTDKRSIEAILDHCLDRIINGQEKIDMILDAYPDLADELRPRLEAALWLTAQKPNTQPRPEFIQASSQRLMARIQSESQIQKQIRLPRPSFWQNLLSSKKFAFQFALVIIVIFSTLVFSNAIASASQNALPGETLFPVKTSFEAAQLAMTFSPIKTAQLHIQYADRRLAEMQILSESANYDNFNAAINNMGEHVTQALQVLQSESAKNAETTKKLAEEVQSSLSRQEQTLTYLKSKAPAKNQAILQQAMEMSSQALGIAQEVIEAGNPTLAATVTSTDTPVVKATDTPIPPVTTTVTVVIMVQPSSALMASETLEPTVTQQPASTTKVKNTPKPANTHKPTQKPTKAPKPIKTPKPDKPTKTPKD